MDLEVLPFPIAVPELSEKVADPRYREELEDSDRLDIWGISMPNAAKSGGSRRRTDVHSQRAR